MAANIISGMTIPKKKDLITMVPTAHPDALDLMRKFFKFNPNYRLTAEEALNHPYLKQFHKEHEKEEVALTEPVSNSLLKIVICLDDNKKFSIR